MVTQAQSGTLQLKDFGVVLTDYKQFGAFFKLTRQGRQRFEATVHALGLEARADLHQQQVVVCQIEFTAELGADLGRIGRRAAVQGNARRQQVEALQRGVVMLDKQRLLDFGNHQDFSLGILGEHRALILGKVLVAFEEAIKRVTQVLRLVFKATVGRVVHVQAGHLVEADQAVHGALGQVGLHPGKHFFVAGVVMERLDRRHQHFKAGGNIAFPDHGVDADLMAALLAFQRNAHEIPLQPAKRKVFVQHKSQLHQRSSSASNNVLNRLATRSGFKRVKHRGHSFFRSNRCWSWAVGV
ncbi:MAG: hypothetical protein ACFWUJ_19385 [Pseudomonas fragi]